MRSVGGSELDSCEPLGRAALLEQVLSAEY